ncbi:MAG: nucleotidyltransferase [Polaromonas sp.]|uniref:SMODS domain-containing nucleotidyltransferase n=1 Tax=Polaromonas sp. TaxID=1869339 RepID=UPI0025FBB19C|nr:nucleotidyltransferase [Polaromonas sp.]MBI2724928.1 nucleotidyltransferase [Polaromonas sp.]
MPRTIEEGFEDFLSKLKATSVETAAAKSHRASIEGAIRANFGLIRFVRIGSFGNGTSISGYSDVDYLACLPTPSLTQSSIYSLQKVRAALDLRYPNTGVRVSSPAVVIPFGTLRSEVTEVVPADFLREESGCKIYDIADGTGGWMKASPDAHNAYVRVVDERLAGKVKPLIRFVKAWKYLRNVPISSFYLEMMIAKYAAGESSIVYPIDVKNIFKNLLSSGLSGINDPMGFSGQISACKSAVNKEEALSALKRATTRAENAMAYAHAGKTSDAFDYWRLVYADAFPNYYYP